MILATLYLRFQQVWQIDLRRIVRYDFPKSYVRLLCARQVSCSLVACLLSILRSAHREPEKGESDLREGENCVRDAKTCRNNELYLSACLFLPRVIIRLYHNCDH